ncbi:MAG: hypothetical protein C5S49_06190 [Candidatus Methanogaster sp.]|nr:MAG: hypothetical protein C5S49_06190 [ANME-2 cluster archaeon]
MRYIHNTGPNQPIVNATVVYPTLLAARTLVQPVCTAADNPTVNSGVVR